MSTHSKHKNENGTILYDDCPRCLEHAKNFGLELDHEMYMAMWNRMLFVQFDQGAYHSKAEILLGRHMYNMALALQRHTTINPGMMPWT